MDIINILLEVREKNKNMKIIEAVNICCDNIISSKNKQLSFALAKPPFNLLSYIYQTTKIRKQIDYSRAYIINNSYIKKFDPGYNTNSFITNLFAQVCDVKVPQLLLTIDNNKIYQVIEYLKQWRDYDNLHPRNYYFIEELAVLLAFDLTVGNGDRFLFITRYLENIIFKNDPDYDQMDIWDNPIINEGNFGFVGNNLWSIDHNAGDLEYLQKLHNITDDKLLYSCCQLMSQYFNFNNIELKIFYDKLIIQYRKNMSYYAKFEEIYIWAINK